MTPLYQIFQTCDDIFIHLDTIRQRDEQTDRRTDRNGISISRYQHNEV